MRTSWALWVLFLAVVVVNCSPIVKREAEEDLSQLNEVYVFEIDDPTDDGDERGDREKRKIGVKLGITNGVINFVFGKLDSFLDAKTRALTALDESNRAKNAAFGIDPRQSATTQFLTNLVSQKIQAATGSIGPVINSATTLLSGASAGLSNALASKIAPLSSLSGGLSGGLGGGASAGGAAGGSAGAGGGAGGGSGGAAGSAILGNILTSKINTLSSLSQSSGGASGGSGGGGGGTVLGGSGGSSSGGGNAGAGAGAGTSTGINLGAFANLGGNTITTTTDNTPVFDRTRVSLEIPSAAFGTGFNLVTNVSKVLNSVILNSARRTQTFFEIFKPFFRGAFAIKGLPSDNPK